MKEYTGLEWSSDSYQEEFTNSIELVLAEATISIMSNTDDEVYDEMKKAMKLIANAPKMLELLQFIKDYGSKCDWYKLENDVELLINKILY